MKARRHRYGTRRESRCVTEPSLKPHRLFLPPHLRRRPDEKTFTAAQTLTPPVALACMDNEGMLRQFQNDSHSIASQVNDFHPSTASPPT
jgi:hypothetical protein